MQRVLLNKKDALNIKFDKRYKILSFSVYVMMLTHWSQIVHSLDSSDLGRASHDKVINLRGTR